MKKVLYIFMIIGLLNLIGCSSSSQIDEVKLDKKMESSIKTLIEALNTNDYSMIENLIVEGYTAPGVENHEYSINILKQVFGGYSKKILGYSIDNAEKEGENTRIYTIFEREDEDKDFDFLLNPKGEFIEINIFRTQSKVADNELDDNIETIPPFIQPKFEHDDGIMYVQAKVGDRIGNFAIDSGAPLLALNSRYFDFEKVNSVGSGGINGTITSSDIQKIDRFEFEGFVLEDFDALVMDMAHLEESSGREILGLISARELAYFETFIDYSNNTLLLLKVDDDGNKQAMIQMPPPSHTIDFELEGHIPVIQSMINGHQLEFGFDTGAQVNVISTKYQDIISDSFVFEENDTLTGADTASTVVPFGLIKEWEIGGNIYKDMRTTLVDMAHLSQDGIIGYQFFSKHPIAINYKKKQIYVWQ